MSALSGRPDNGFWRYAMLVVALLALAACARGGNKPVQQVEYCEYAGPYHSYETRPCDPGDRPGHVQPHPCSWCEGGWYPPRPEAHPGQPPLEEHY